MTSPFDVDLDHLAEVALVRLFHCEVTPFHAALPRQKSPGAPYPLFGGHDVLVTTPDVPGAVLVTRDIEVGKKWALPSGCQGLERKAKPQVCRHRTCAARRFPGSTKKVPSHQAFLFYVFVL